MIAVDWGTSSLRAYRLDAAGSVLAQRSTPAALLACQGRFEAVLAEQIDGWSDPHIVMAGMIGSRNGWREVPYVACPAGADAIAAGMLAFEAPALPGRQLFIAPGMSDRPAGLHDTGTPEVMRGEETQVLGLLDALPGAGPHTLCLPGTHSKWITVEQGRITRLHTAMTGELYALLTQHSLLGALMDKEAGDDEAAFARGLETSRGSGGLPNQLFSVRTLGLFGELSGAAAPSYLSGLLVGHELNGLAPAAGTVHLIGSAALTRRYERALAARSLQAIAHAEALTARGLHRLALARGLVD
jgi:2-dehydro-3-deoxygalactonokinase